MMQTRTSFTFLLLTAWLLVPQALAAEKAISRIAFGSCYNQDKPAPVFDALNASGPEVCILLGDNIYADTLDMDVMKAKYAKLGALPAYHKLKAQARILATWDDHDYGVNDGGAEYPMRAQSQQAFLDFFQDPPDSPRRLRPGVYDACVIGPPGQRVQIILLDTRYFRSPLLSMDPSWKVKDPQNPKADADGFVTKTSGRYKPNPDPAATVLGDAQWRWLEQQLKTPVEVRILASSIQFVADDQPWEKWGNFPLEQARLFKLIARHEANGIIVVSGDRHRAEISQSTDAPLPYPLYDYTSSGFNQSSGPEKQDEPNRRRMGHNYIYPNFGVIHIDWDRADPEIRVEIRGVDNKPALAHAVKLSELKCRK